MSRSFEYPNEVEVIRESKSGLSLIVRDDEGEEFNVPYSQIHEDSEVFKPTGPNSIGTLVVSE